MIDAPLEKLLSDDCSGDANALYDQLVASLDPSTESDILAAIRAVAVALDVPPPGGVSLKIYRKVLGELPRAVLYHATEQLIREYVFPTFPKPAEWVMRTRDDLKLIDRAKLLMTIYPKRRKMAELYYGKRR